MTKDMKIDIKYKEDSIWPNKVLKDWSKLDNPKNPLDVYIPEYENSITKDEVMSVLKFMKQLEDFYKEQEIINNLGNNFACDWKENGFKEKCKTECDWCKYWNNYLK